MDNEIDCGGEQNQKSILLQELSPFVRFGLMNGKYFVEKVKPLNILTKDEIIEILSYQHAKTGDCAGFNVGKRKHWAGVNLSWRKEDDNDDEDDVNDEVAENVDHGRISSFSWGPSGNASQTGGSRFAW